MSNRFLWMQKAEIAPVEERLPSKTGIYLLCTRRLHGSGPLFPLLVQRSMFDVRCSMFDVRPVLSPPSPRWPVLPPIIGLGPLNRFCIGCIGLYWIVYWIQNHNHQ